MILDCPTCFRRVRRDGPGQEAVLQEGGARKLGDPPTLASWRIWVRSLRGDLPPVAGTCPACGGPWVSQEAGIHAAMVATFVTPRGPVQVGPDGITGPDGPLTLDAADAFVTGQLAPSAWREWADPRALFLLGPALIFTVMAVGWVVAASYVVNFVLAAGLQGDLSMPLAR